MLKETEPREYNVENWKLTEQEIKSKKSCSANDDSTAEIKGDRMEAQRSLENYRWPHTFEVLSNEKEMSVP